MNMNDGTLILFVYHVFTLFSICPLHVVHFHLCLFICMVLDYVLLNRLGQDNGLWASIILPYQRVGSRIFHCFCGADNGKSSLAFIDWPESYSM
jgi:hypothetical protein